MVAVGTTIADRPRTDTYGRNQIGSSLGYERRNAGREMDVEFAGEEGVDRRSVSVAPNRVSVADYDDAEIRRPIATDPFTESTEYS